MKNSSKNVALGGVIAASYVILVLISNMMGLGMGIFQIRLSEALCVLPCFTPAAVPGLFAGCILGNLLCGGEIIDIVLGSLATLIGALGTRFFRKNQVLALVPPILANTFIVPIVLSVGYGISGSYLYLVLMIGLSEIISCGIFGYLLGKVLGKSFFNTGSLR